MRYEIDISILTASKRQLKILKVLINIFILYFLMLAVLPPLQGCKNDNITARNKNSNHTEIPCSPFCGEDGCGIVITFQVDIPPPVDLPFVEIERFVGFDDLLFRSGITQWHPPQA
ncbi:MAG: hypothetical protein WC389_09800 [Lutibacter sp.]